MLMFCFIVIFHCNENLACYNNNHNSDKNNWDDSIIDFKGKSITYTCNHENVT